MSMYQYSIRTGNYQVISMDAFDKLRLTSQREDFDDPSLFVAENMLREARRQRSLATLGVPLICVLDPDGDMLSFLQSGYGASQMEGWACYHTDLWVVEWHGLQLGVVGRAVGAPFAVLVAEELFASGCGLLVSITSAGRIGDSLPESCMILIDEAVRGEGTSQAYLPPAPMVQAHPDLIDHVFRESITSPLPLTRGMVWTTDAPFRETAAVLAAVRDAGVLAVEMEAAGLYAFAQANQRSVVCFGHVTNSMAIAEGDFDKGPSDGAAMALEAVRVAAAGWRAHLSDGELGR